MPIDPSIALGFRPPQIEGPMNLLSQGVNLQNAAQANQINMLKMEEARRSQQQAEAMRQALRGRDLTDAAQRQNLMREYPMEAPGILKPYSELANTDSLIKERESKIESEKQKRQFEIANEVSSGFKYVYDNPTPQNAHMAIDMLVRLGKMPPDQAAQFKANISQLGDKPEEIKAFAEVVYRQGIASKDQLAKTANVNMGGTEAFTSTDPVNGKTTIMGTAVRTQSPDNKASVGAQYANAAALREQATATRDAARIQTEFTNETNLRKEFEGLPEVKNYKMAYPSYAGIKDAVTRNTPASDINIVYGLAKLYDPTSVVREGEYATVANSPNIPERIKGWAQFLAGGGKLTAETKKQILAEAESRIGTYKAEAEKAKASYTEIAKRRGIDPANVFQTMGDITTGYDFSKADAILNGGK